MEQETQVTRSDPEAAVEAPTGRPSFLQPHPGSPHEVDGGALDTAQSKQATPGPLQRWVRPVCPPAAPHTYFRPPPLPTKGSVSPPAGLLGSGGRRGSYCRALPRTQRPPKPPGPGLPPAGLRPPPVFSLDHLLPLGQGGNQDTSLLGHLPSGDI